VWPHATASVYPADAGDTNRVVSAASHRSGAMRVSDQRRRCPGPAAAVARLRRDCFLRSKGHATYIKEGATLLSI